MAQTEWREKLNSNSLFTSLSENFNKIKQGKDSKNILECIDDSIFVWDEFNQCVLSTNVDGALKSSDSSTCKHQVNFPCFYYVSVSKYDQLLLQIFCD